MTDSKPGTRDWWIGLARSGFGATFWAFAAFALVMGGLCYLLLGPQAFSDAVSQDLELLGNMLPRVVAALTLAGFVWALLPRDTVSHIVRRYTGLRGLLVAAAAGLITPGGPASAFPLLALLGSAGADRGILVAYITSWALLGVQRILVWDLPFMGAEFSATRFLVCLPLPILAGVIARRLPFRVKLVDSSPQRSTQQ